MVAIRPPFAALQLLLQALSFVLVNSGALFAQQPPPTGQTVTAEQLAGNYQLPDGHVVGINPFSGDGGSVSPLFTDYATGAIRTLLPQQGERFGMGPSFGIQSPTERTLRVVRSQAGAITGLALLRPGEDAVIAKRLPAAVQDVEFQSENATLAGTILMPPTPGPHPAIVLLHGSGPLNRYSFGPYPRFFASLGLAVLIYDKRGTGESTGKFFDRAAVYPEPYLRDAVAAVKFLKTRSDINPREVGVWGTSEGGMLSTQVAAIESLAFAINSSGFVMPLWEQVLYNVEAQLRADGFPAAEVADAVAFETLAIEVMRTGEHWDGYQVAQAAALQKRWWPAYFGSSKGFSMPEDIRWQWEHVYRFDSRPALRAVSCPVLGLFGALDTSTPARRAANNLEDGLRASGNQDVTIRIFEQGNHPLMEARTGGNAEIPSLTRMAPELFATIRTWVLSKITVAR
jgi:uncharacterized protein